MTGLARIGAVLYTLWGLAHYAGAYGIYHSAQPMPPTMERGRLEQVAFYLTFFATASIAFAWLNWRNDRLGFWGNAVTVSVGDIPFIMFILVPGYMPVWPGIAPPTMWILALTCTAVAQLSGQNGRCQCPGAATVGH